MASWKVASNPELAQVNEIASKDLMEAAKDPGWNITVQCQVCGHNYFLNCVPRADVKTGIISDAHGPVTGYQIRFNCPNCQTLLRFDEDEIRIRINAVPDSQHS